MTLQTNCEINVKIVKWNFAENRLILYWYTERMVLLKHLKI